MRTIKLLETLSLRPQSTVELAAHLGCHVKTVRHTLHKFREDGYVWQDRRHLWHVDIRLRQLGAALAITDLGVLDRHAREHGLERRPPRDWWYRGDPRWDEWRARRAGGASS